LPIPTFLLSHCVLLTNPSYAKKLNLVINRSAEARNYLQFADGSYKQTLGQTHTHWTFASGKRILITFEVLKNCASNVVIGEQILYENEVFTEHVDDFRVLEMEKKGSELAPFDFLNRVEGTLEKGKRMLGKKKKKDEGVRRKSYPTLVIGVVIC
jgi:hypothetical protein